MLPWLDDMIMLKGVNGSRRPIAAAKENIGVKGCDIFGVRRKPGYADVEAILL
jgi:hypothetical protein